MSLSTKIILWLFIFYNITFITCLVNFPVSEFENLLKGQSQLKWNKRLTNALIRQLHGVSLLECVDGCLNTSTCKSFNYKRILPICELNFETEESHVEKKQITHEKDFIYGDVKYWNICERDGYIYVANISLCLKIHDEHMNWTDARSVCLSEKADLIIVNTTEIYKYIKTVIPHEKPKWVGATDLVVEGQWRWVDGSIFSKESVSLSWSLVYLDNKAYNTLEDGDCLRFHGNYFYDNNCDNTQGFICQKNIF